MALPSPPPPNNVAIIKPFSGEGIVYRVNKCSFAWGRWGKGFSFTLIVLSVPIVLSPLKFQQKLERENDELRLRGRRGVLDKYSIFWSR